MYRIGAAVLGYPPPPGDNFHPDNNIPWETNKEQILSTQFIVAMKLAWNFRMFRLESYTALQHKY